MSALSQDEIDALVDRLAAPGDDAAAAKRVRDFDFRFARKAEKFPSNQLQTIRSVHDTFARLLNNALSLYMRARVEATTSRLEQISYGDFLAASEGASLLVILSMDPLPGSGMLRIDLGLVFGVIDRLLGGPGWAPKLRDLTEIERSLATRFLARVLASYREAWSPFGSIAFKVEAMESDPQLVPRIIPPDESVAAATCELKIGESGGAITFCLPYAVFSGLGPQLAEPRWSSGAAAPKAASEKDLERLEHRLGGAEVEVEVDLGSTTVSLRQLAALRVGDVLVFERETSAPLEARVNGREKFHVYPGVHRDRLAVQVADVLEEPS